MAATRAQPAYAMAQIDSIEAASAASRAMMHGKDHAIPLAERHDLDARLHARSLFGQDELAAGEIAAWRRQEKSSLQRKDMLAIEILMKTIIVALAVAQQERGRLGLSRAMTTSEKRRVAVGIAPRDAESFVPAIGNRGERRIERGAEADNKLGKGMAEILVLAAPVAMARHHDPAAEAVRRIIGRDQHLAFLRRQHRRHDRAAIGIETGGNLPPVSLRDPRRDVRRCRRCPPARYSAGGHAASPSGRARLRAAPHR